MAANVKTINIKDDRPTVEEARRRLASAIASAKTGKVHVLKIVHGYGSGGSGGALRVAIRRSLAKRRKESVIEEFIPGERWSIFDERAAELIRRYPGLARDRDLEDYNEGMTVVFL
jgi:hypothetical protein